MAVGNSNGGAGGAQTQFVQLERQIERGNLFTHTALSDNAERIHEAESFLYGLIDVLVEKGLATPEEVFEAASKVRGEMDAKGETLGPGVALRVDSKREARGDFVEVNCAERMHVCKAVCCKLNFALSAEEVESGKVKWDLGRPYFIRREASGHCTHYDAGNGCCSIYEDRPAVCRGYSCAGDKRIWKDFEKMQLNDEWLGEHLSGETVPRLASAMLMRPEKIESDTDSDDDAEVEPPNARLIS
ncbi:MAG TPA: YkgJ family cysteine cluster protein [Pyrinomonadaceae bacterium]|nr:YkgJ family cysteine cluster protein [Pyrinomonadaceae bacterium]